MVKHKRSLTHARAEDGSVVLSTDTPCPQDGLILAAEGWDLSRYEKVPCKMFYNHAASYGEDLPIGRWEGLQVKDGKLIGKPVFASDEYDKAATIQKLWDGGFLDDVSVSFSVDGKALTGPVQVDGREYMVSAKHSLLECSIVGIGADQNAGKGRMDEAVTRGIITEGERNSLLGDLTRVSILEEKVNHLAAVLETVRKDADLLRAELEKAQHSNPHEQPNVPAAPITLDLDAIRTAVNASLSQTVKKSVHEAFCLATGRLPD